MSHAPEPQDGHDDSCASAPLTDLGRQVLDFEREWWRFAGAKDTVIRDRFSMGAGAYYRHLGQLMDCDAALEHDPLLVRRLRRQRLMRQRERSARRLDQH